jgi:2,4-dienoyl-CoA reductase-like NADH-dependent reductase (Old Yellow Enzyme family)
MITVFDSFKIKNISLPNRIVRSATAERIAMRDEHEGECLGNKYAALAEGGVGLIISGHVAAHPSGRLHPSMPLIFTGGNLKAWRQALTLTHKSGGTLFIQLNHGGGRCREENGAKPVCVSYLPERPNDPMLGDELTGARIQELIKAFADSARNARAIGADGVQIHAAHGYLVSQFLSPLTNHRKDEWGGALEGRASFLRSIIRAVREAVGADFPLGVKLGACDDDPSGLKIEETLQVAKWLEEDGIDFIEISGAFRSDIALRRVMPGKNEGYYLPFAAQFKKVLKIPVLAVGGLRSLEKMNEALALNQCDAVSMSRPLICQPDLPMILRVEGKEGKRGKSECRGCNLCLVKHDRLTACHAKGMAGHTSKK